MCPINAFQMSKKKIGLKIRWCFKENLMLVYAIFTHAPYGMNGDEELSPFWSQSLTILIVTDHHTWILHWLHREGTLRSCPGTQCHDRLTPKAADHHQVQVLPQVCSLQCFYKINQIPQVFNSVFYWLPIIYIHVCYVQCILYKYEDASKFFFCLVLSL